MSGAGEDVRVAGVLGPTPRGALARAIFLTTGLALFGWVRRLLRFLVRARTEAEVVLGPRVVHVHREDVLLGRLVRREDAAFSWAAVAGVVRHVRHPHLRTIVGLTALATGVLIGGFLAVDGVRTASTTLLMSAATLILLGVGLDFAFDVLLPSAQHRVMIDIHLLPSTILRLTRVPQDQADRFLEAATECLGDEAEDGYDEEDGDQEHPDDGRQSGADAVDGDPDQETTHKEKRDESDKGDDDDPRREAPAPSRSGDADDPPDEAGSDDDREDPKAEDPPDDARSDEP